MLRVSKLHKTIKPYGVLIKITRIVYIIVSVRVFEVRIIPQSLFSALEKHFTDWDQQTMEEKQRRILDRNFFLLVKNMVLTDEFYDCLRRENVVPETMIKDIEVSYSNQPNTIVS